MSNLIAPPNYTLFNATGGMDDVLVSVGTSIPPFIPFLLVFVWVIVFAGGSAAQNTRTGRSDSPVWAVMASLATFLVSLVLSIKSGVISPLILSMTVGITILSAIWLFLTKDREF